VQGREETRGRNLASVLAMNSRRNATSIPVIFDFFILGNVGAMYKLRRVQLVKTELLRPTKKVPALCYADMRVTVTSATNSASITPTMR
jgi:hypothetical protein